MSGMGSPVDVSESGGYLAEPVHDLDLQRGARSDAVIQHDISDVMCRKNERGQVGEASTSGCSECRARLREVSFFFRSPLYERVQVTLLGHEHMPQIVI